MGNYRFLVQLNFFVLMLILLFLVQNNYEKRNNSVNFNQNQSYHHRNGTLKYLHMLKNKTAVLGVGPDRIINGKVAELLREFLQVKKIDFYFIIYK